MKNPESILELTIKKQWFDMIASGVKLQEYREIKKYWISRLMTEANGQQIFKKFQAVRFRNGYGPNAPAVTVELKGIKIGSAVPEWSGSWPGIVFVLQLGQIIINKTTIMNRQGIRSEIERINEEIIRLKEQKTELIRSRLLLCDDVSQFEEKTESHPPGKSQLINQWLDGSLVGRVKWTETHIDEGDGTPVFINRQAIVRVDGKWTGIEPQFESLIKNQS